MKQKIILAVSILIFLCTGFAVSQLKIVSNMEEMLHTDSESLKASKDFNQYFIGQDQAVIVVKESGDSNEGNSFKEQAQMFLNELATELENEPYINSVFYKVNTGEIAQFVWAYLDMDTYLALDEALTEQNFQRITNLLGEAEKQLDIQKQEAAQYIVNEEESHLLMFIRPMIDEKNYMASRSDFYDGIQIHLRELLEKRDFNQLDAGLTGGAFIQDIEADTVAFDGLFGTLGITLVLILLIVVLFFGGLKLPLLSLYPLALGTVVAAAFAYILYGSLNMFAVSFALLLLGLGIDYAVHFITRYQEERTKGLTVDNAVSVSQRATGGSIIIGALTTALAFASFAFAKFKAFEQMGVISAIGIISLCIGMLTLIPALISLFGKKVGVKRRNGISLQWIQTIVSFVLRKKCFICIFGFAVIASLFPFVIGTDLKSDITAIYPKNIPSIKWAEEMEKSFDYDIDTISFYADDEEKLQEVYAGLSGNRNVKGIDSVFEYMPDHMDEKLRIINRLDNTLKGLGVDAFGDFELRRFTIDDLPENIKTSFVGADGKLRVEIIPAINLYDRKQYDELVSAILSITGRYPVGMPTIMNEITEVVKKDIVMISLFCFSIAFLIAWIMFKKLKLAILTMLPLALTLITTVGLLSVLQIEINAFSIAAFPLVIGIGVDSSIHLIHRLNEKSDQSIAEKTMHTGKAIILTALTTIVGFGSLAMINHPGMANLGLTVAIGIMLSMVCTLIVVPVGYDIIHRGISLYV